MDRDNSDAISLASAAKLLKIDNQSPSPVTLWRWARKGKLGVKLYAWRRGRSLVTTPQHVREFERKVAEADARRWSEHHEDTFSATHEQHDDTDARAEALGV